MTLDLSPRPDHGFAPDVPVDWEDWDHSAFADVLADDPSWCLPSGAVPWPTTSDDSRSVLDADPEDLSGAEAIEFLIELQRIQSRLAALEARALVATAGAYRRERRVTVIDPATQSEKDLTIPDEVREEIAAALHRSSGVVHDQLVTARLLAGPLSATRQALADGRITAQHARVIAEQAGRLSTSHAACHQPPDDDSVADAIERAEFARDCGRLQERVLTTAEGTTPAKTRSRARAVVAAIDTAAQEKRRQQAKAAIDVHIYPDEDGLAVLLARMPIEEAVRAHAAIDARARATRAECDATLGRLRVTALLEALCGTPAAMVVTEVQVVVDAAVVLGESDQPGTIVVGRDGPQPISAQAVRDLLADPDVPTALRRLVTDPVTGHLLDRGRSSYRVTDAMRAFLAVRDSTCRHPGCTRRASRCQVDHAVAWDQGGGTDRANTGLLCTRHHQLKTHAAWAIIESREDGSVVWRSPQDRRYEVDPPPVLTPRQAKAPTSKAMALKATSTNTSKAPPGGADPPF